MVNEALGYVLSLYKPTFITEIMNEGQSDPKSVREGYLVPYLQRFCWISFYYGKTASSAVDLLLLSSLIYSTAATIVNPFDKRPH